MYFIKKIRKINESINTFLEIENNIFTKIYIYIDFILAALIHGCGISDYFQYNFFLKRYNERKQFISYRQRMEIVNKMNDKDRMELFDNKFLFNEKFDVFLKREWIHSKSISKEEFLSFTKDKKDLFIKELVSSGGKGVSKLNLIVENKDELYGKISTKELLIEESIIQHSDMAIFNPESVNTVRIVTMLDALGNPSIINAVFRCGVDNKTADNFHHEGLAALIDIETGLVYTQAVNKIGKKYIFHPTSSVPIVGFTIPFWDKMKEVAEKAATVVPEVKYVGWDLCILENGEISIIEGNCKADPDIAQMPDQIGKMKQYYQHIRRQM